MEPLGGGFGGFDAEGLERVRFEKFAAGFGFFRVRDDAFASSDGKQCDVIAAAVFGSST